MNMKNVEVYVNDDYSVLVYNNNELVGYLTEYFGNLVDAELYAQDVVLELGGQVFVNNELTFDTNADYQHA
jgi:hypothetical protein